METPRDELDLGDGRKLIFVEHKGEKRVAANVVHPPVEGKCSGDQFIPFKDRAWANAFEGDIVSWKVEKDEPFTLSPSILCRACGDHGFVRDGKWVSA